MIVLLRAKSLLHILEGMKKMDEDIVSFFSPNHVFTIHMRERLFKLKMQATNKMEVGDISYNFTHYDSKCEFLPPSNIIL